MAEEKTPETDQLRDISVYTFQCEMTRMERTNHRMFIMLILMLFALLGTNAGWLYYESLWEPYTETTTQSVTQSAESESGNAVNRFVGGDSYGEIDADSNYDNN